MMLLKKKSEKISVYGTKEIEMYFLQNSIKSARETNAMMFLKSLAIFGWYGWWFILVLRVRFVISVSKLQVLYKHYLILRFLKFLQLKF